MITALLAGLLPTHQAPPTRPVITAYSSPQDAANRLATTVFTIAKPPAGYTIVTTESTKRDAEPAKGLASRTVIHIRYLNRQTKHAIHFLQSPAATKITADEHGKQILATSGFLIQDPTKSQRATHRGADMDFVVSAPMMTPNALKTLLKDLGKVSPR